MVSTRCWKCRNEFVQPDHGPDDYLCPHCGALPALAQFDRESGLGSETRIFFTVLAVLVAFVGVLGLAALILRMLGWL